MADKPEKPPIQQEWEKAQEGWDTLRRATGAIPPLPEPRQPKTRLGTLGNELLSRGEYWLDQRVREREQSAEKPVVSDGPFPKSLKEALPYITWGSVIFAFGFEFVAELVEGNYGRAIIALIGGLAVTAVALHSKTWLERTNPNLAFAGALALLLTLILSPFIEEKHWPFSNWVPIVVHDHAGSAEISKATAEIQAKLDRAIEERDSANERLTKEDHSATEGTQPTAKTGDEIGYITLDYSTSGATITGTSSSVKEATVQAPRRTDGLSSIIPSYSLPIDIVFNEKPGAVDVFAAPTEFSTLNSSSPNIAVTKNEGAQLEVLLTPSNVFLSNNLSTPILLTFRKR